jgi:hypothetical protein
VSKFAIAFKFRSGETLSAALTGGPGALPQDILEDFEDQLAELYKKRGRFKVIGNRLINFEEVEQMEVTEL